MENYTQLMFFLQFLLALAPVAVLAFILYRFDRKQPEPIGQLLKAIGYGVISAVVAVVASLILEQFGRGFADHAFANAVFTALFGAAIPEEAAKMLMLCLVIRNNKYFDEHLDGIIYAAFVALGFAGIENIGYVLTSEDFVGTSLSRAIFAVPGHYAFGVAMGYFISLAYFSKNKEEKKKWYICAYFIPVALHFIYDALLMVAEVAPAIAGLLSLAFYYFVYKMHKYAVGRVKVLQQRDETDYIGPYSPLDLAIVFHDNDSTSFLYHNQKVYVYQTGNFDIPVSVQNGEDPFKFLSLIEGAIDAEEKVVILHNGSNDQFLLANNLSKHLESHFHNIIIDTFPSVCGPEIPADINDLHKVILASTMKRREA